MGYSTRRYLITADETIYRMANTAFDRMLRAPETCPMLELAGRRVRTTEIVVKLVGGQPAAVVNASFSILVFDDAGYADVGAYLQRQHARAEGALAPALGKHDRDGSVVDAASKFMAQGGSWLPSAALARTLTETALGRQRCLRPSGSTTER